MKKKKTDQSPPEDLRRQAEERIKFEGSLPEEIPPAEVQRVIHELRVHQIELEMQNEELRQAQELLEESRSRYLDLYDFAPIGYLTLDKRGFIKEANLIAAGLLQVERPRLINVHFAHFIVLEDRGAFRRHLNLVLQEEERQTIELRLKRKDGQEFFALLESAFYQDITGSGLCRTAFSDISKRRQAEANLRESEERFRVLFETAGANIGFLSPDGRILEVNKQTERVTNWSRQEIIGKNVFEMFIPEEIRDLAKAEVSKALAGARVIDLEVPICLRDKTQRLFLWNINPVLSEQGQILGTIVVGQDITQRKEAENRLMAERQRLFSLLEGLPGVVSLLAPNYRFNFVNRVFRERFGDQEGKFCYEVLHARSEPCANCPMPQVLAGRQINDFEWTSPESHTYQYFLYPFADIDSSPLMLELGIDITPRKQAEELVRRRANQQAAAAQLGQMAIGGADLSALMSQAVTLVSESLVVEYSKVLELLPTRNALRLVAGVGWKEGLVGQAVVGAGLDSQAGYTLASATPVIVEDFPRESRFSGPPLLHEHGVVSGLSVIIGGKTRPFGVLGAHTKRKQAFNQDDIHFLQAIANVLSEAIERKRVEAELRRSEQNLRSLTFRLFTIQETERKQVAQELHESLAQTLSALTLQTSFIKGRLKKDEQLLSREFEESLNLLQSTTKNVRKLSQELTPSILEDFGLFSALKYLINNFCEENNMEECRVELDEEINLFSPKVQINIYRVIEEALLNVGQHGEASQIFVSGKIKDGAISFMLEDNGVGFNVDDVLSGENMEKSYGLHTMEQRINMLGGSLHIESQKGEGTKMTFSIPIDLKARSKS